MPRWIAAILSAVVAASSYGCASDWKPAFDEIAEPGLFETVPIADPNEALTFARVETNGTRRVILVVEYRNGAIRGMDLSAALGYEVTDPIRIFNQLGYDGLRDLVVGPDATLVTAAAASLEIPIDLRAHHIAAATNFPEHAGDAGVERGPFLFPKLVQPTGPLAPVSAGEGLLDYEAEFAWVTVAPLAPDGAPEFMGLILCNDYTDRDTLLHKIDSSNVESGDGFATGKSFPGYLPVGNLFVVPRDHRRFTANLELRLYVNGRLRQRSLAKEMIWDFDDIIAHTWAWKDRRWDHRGVQVSLMDSSEAIPDRTLILSGTPHGTVFAGIHTRHILAGVTRWLFGGWSDPIASHVISEYVTDARAAGAYLRVGDRVEIHVNRLGVIRNPIGP